MTLTSIQLIPEYIPHPYITELHEVARSKRRTLFPKGSTINQTFWDIERDILASINEEKLISECMNLAQDISSRISLYITSQLFDQIYFPAVGKTNTWLDSRI
jgi:hypothetical protein